MQLCATIFATARVPIVKLFLQIMLRNCNSYVQLLSHEYALFPLIFSGRCAVFTDWLKRRVKILKQLLPAAQPASGAGEL